MSSKTFTLLASVAASTKRHAAMSGGKRGAPVTSITSLFCTPLDPLDPETRERLALDSPHRLLQTFAQGGLDIVAGDTLVVGSTEYPIKVVGAWLWRPDDADYVHVVVEELE